MIAMLALCGGCFFATASLEAQAAAAGTTSAPSTDGSVQASPASSRSAVGAGPATDSSVNASPLPAGRVAQVPVRVGDTLMVALTRTVSSATAHNGERVTGRLSAPLPRRAGGAPLPVGTPVTLTVVSVARAGLVSSFGELTLQAVQAGRDALFTLPETYRGKRGARELADSAPAKGGEATLPAGLPLRFQVQPPPAPATQQPGNKTAGVPQPVPQR